MFRSTVLRKRSMTKR
jgi:hypothetical protein